MSKLFGDYMHACLVFQADSGFFCEGYSSDEDVLLKEEFKGNIIKQGCLLKQVPKKQTYKKKHLCKHDNFFLFGNGKTYLTFTYFNF